MIVKKENVTSKALANFILFIHKDESSPEDISSSFGYVTRLKSVNPGTEKGLYSVDLEFRENYTASNGVEKVTDPKFLTAIYEILTRK